MASVSASATIQADVLHSFVKQVFERAGVPPEQALDAADVLLYASRRGVDTHGVRNLKPIYIDGFVAGHITPEAFDGGLIALVKDNDIIEINVSTKAITLKVDEKTLHERREKWQQPALNATKGVLFKYAKSVTTAAEGCITDAP